MTEEPPPHVLEGPPPDDRDFGPVEAMRADSARDRLIRIAPESEWQDIRQLVSEEAEQQLIGACLLSADALTLCRERVEVDAFYFALHRSLWRAMCEISDGGGTADAVTLASRFDGDPALIQAGGARYLSEIVSTVWSPQGAPDHARMVRDLATRRRALLELQEIGWSLIDAGDAWRPAGPALRDGADRLDRLSETVATRRPLHDIGDAMRALADRTVAIRDAKAAGNEPEVVAFGLRDLDRIMGGLWPGNLVVIAARPAMGKSTLARHLATAQARLGRPVLLASLEMTGEEIAEALVLHHCGIPQARLRTAELARDEWRMLQDASDDLRQLPLHLQDDGCRTVADIARRARRIAGRAGRPPIVIVDYLQLLQAEGRSRVEKITEISRDLKLLAVELDTPVVALSQLSRAVEQRDDKRPQLSDLRESGSIEQDANAVLFLYREEYYVARREPAETDPAYPAWQAEYDACHNLAEVIVAKNRSGETGAARCFFDVSRGRFGDLARGDARHG